MVIVGIGRSFDIIVTITSFSYKRVLRQPTPDVGLILSAFASFDSELRQVDDPESVLAIWLYALYSTIYASAFSTIPAGVLGIASLGVGLAVREAKEMV